MKEFNNVKKETLDTLLKELTDNREYYKRCESLKDGELDYVNVWKNACEEVEKV